MPDAFGTNKLPERQINGSNYTKPLDIDEGYKKGYISYAPL
jgi:hypothetical protein